MTFLCIMASAVCKVASHRHSSVDNEGVRKEERREKKKKTERGRKRGQIGRDYALRPDHAVSLGPLDG